MPTAAAADPADAGASTNVRALAFILDRLDPDMFTVTLRPGETFDDYRARRDATGDIVDDLVTEYAALAATAGGGGDDEQPPTNLRGVVAVKPSPATTPRPKPTDAELPAAS